MHVDPHEFHSQRFPRLGLILERDAALITGKWMTEAVRYLPDASPSRREVMRNSLPEYVALLGRQLGRLGQEAGETDIRTGEEHGRQRWEVGWSLDEVVRDYQILRSVIVRHVNMCLDDPLTLAEVIALNFTLDDAISGSVLAFVEQSEQAYRKLNESLEVKVGERTSQLKALSLALLQAEQRERQRTARLLHEHLQQILFAARLRLEKLTSQLPTETSRSLAGEIDQLLSQGLSDTRNLSISLCPPMLHEPDGLRSALEWLQDSMRRRYDFRVDLHLETVQEPQNPQLREFLFQAIQELLLNAVKHSGGSSATVQLTRPAPQLIQVTVQDAGRGMTSAEVNLLTGFGLADITQRVLALGGSFDLRPAPDGGACATLLLPEIGLPC